MSAAGQELVLVNSEARVDENAAFHLLVAGAVGNR